MADDIRIASSEPLQIFGLDELDSVDNMGFNGIGGPVGEHTQLISPNCSTFDSGSMNAFVVPPTWEAQVEILEKIIQVLGGQGQNSRIISKFLKPGTPLLRILES